MKEKAKAARKKKEGKKKFSTAHQQVIFSHLLGSRASICIALVQEEKHFCKKSLLPSSPSPLPQGVGGSVTVSQPDPVYHAIDFYTFTHLLKCDVSYLAISSGIQIFCFHLFYHFEHEPGETLNRQGLEECFGCILRI